MKYSDIKSIRLMDKKIDIFHPKKNEYINVAYFANQKYDKRTTFNYSFFDFGDLFSKLINSKSTESNIDNIFCLPESIETASNFQTIKDYSNGNEKLSLGFSKKVLNAFKDLFLDIDIHFKWTKDKYFIVPLNGGGFVINLFQLNADIILPIEAKRIPGKKIGYLGLGMNIDNSNLDKINETLTKFNGKEVNFLEVCIASGMTTIGFLIDLYIRGIKPKKIKVLTIASSIQGIKMVNMVAQDLNFNISFYTGQLIENVADFYDVSQDSIIYEDGSFVVKSPENAYKIVHKI